VGAEELGPPGRLARSVVAGDAALTGFTSKQLARELLARLRAGAFDSNDGRYDVEADGFADLGLALLRQFDVEPNRFSRSNVAARFDAYFSSDPSHPASPEGEMVVELGCGGRNPLSTLFVFVLLGARRAVGVDLDTIADIPEAVRALARCAAWMLTDPRLVVNAIPFTREQVASHLAATRFDLVKLFAGDPSGVDRDRLDFRRESVTRLGFGDGEVDLCCSTSFLEHVDDVEAAIAEMARITRRGGRGVHGIDGIDHRNYQDAGVHKLKFLEERTADPIIFGCNRIRPHQFLPIFERHGFEVRRVIEWGRLEVDAEMQAKFVEPYRSMAREDLASAGKTIWVRRR
jgi:SAM-dependent methyltransferase